MYETDYDFNDFFKKKESFEKKLEKRKHTMEFIRTVIGFIVLGILIFILYNLLHK